MEEDSQILKLIRDPMFPKLTYLVSYRIFEILRASKKSEMASFFKTNNFSITLLDAKAILFLIICILRRLFMSVQAVVKLEKMLFFLQLLEQT